jgi:hypothetical protein
MRKELKTLIDRIKRHQELMRELSELNRKLTKFGGVKGKDDPKER